MKAGDESGRRPGGHAAKTARAAIMMVKMLSACRLHGLLRMGIGKQRPGRAKNGDPPARCGLRVARLHGSAGPGAERRKRSVAYLRSRPP